MHGDGKNQYGEEDPRELPQDGAAPTVHSNTALETLSKETRDDTRTLPTEAEIMTTSPTFEHLLYELNTQGYQFNIEPAVETRLTNMGQIRRAKVEYWRRFFLYYKIGGIQQAPNARVWVLGCLRRMWADIQEIERSGQ
jgi:hypothetical protein